jgi:hypothetical protein
MDNFIPGVWDAPIVAHFVRTSAVMDAMNEHRRRGHSEPEQSDKEWDRLRTERKLRYNKWRKLTDELIADGELGFNEDRPTRWVYDETEVEYRARIEAKRV